MLFEPGVIEDLRQRLSGAGTAEGSTTPSEMLSASEQALLDAAAQTIAQSEDMGMDDAAATPAPVRSSGFKTTFQPSAFDAVLPDAEHEHEGDVDGEEVDVDGAPVEDDVDGAPMEDDVDGAPVVIAETEADVDGVEVDIAESLPPSKPKVAVVHEDDAMELGSSSEDDIF